MKFFGYIVTFFALLICGLYVLLFTGLGNSFLVKHAENLIKEKSGLDVKFAKFQLNFTQTNIIATINDEIVAQINGKLSIFSQNMDLNYTLSANNLKTAGLSLAKPIGLKGQVRGKFNDFDANGAGEILGSNLTFLANIKEYKPLALTLDAKRFSLTEIFALAKQPEYLSGFVDVLANVKENSQKPDGNATIVISANPNVALLQRDFNITLPTNFSISANSNATIKADQIAAVTQILTPIATANAAKTHYNITTKELKTDLNIDIADLAKLEPIVKQKLNGTLNAKANVALNNGKIALLNALINGLGGNIEASLNDTTLNAKINNIKLEEVLKLAAKPAIASATINGTASINNISDSKNMLGEISLKTSGGALNQACFKQLGLNMPNGVNFELDLSADVKNAASNFKANLLSSLLNLKNLNGSYNLENKSGDANFALDVSDLAKLESLVGAKLSGAVSLDAKAKLKDNALSALTLGGKALGGDVKAQMIDGGLVAELANLNLKDLFLLLGQKPLAEAVISADAKLSSLDMKNLNGNIKIDAKNGKFYEQAMSESLKKPFPAGVTFGVQSDIKLAKSVANFNANVDTTLANLKQISGSFDLASKSLNAQLLAVVPELAKLKFLTDTKLNGPLNAQVKAQKSGENLNATLTSKISGGNLNATLKSGKLDALLDGFTFKELSALLGFEHIYDGVGVAKLAYEPEPQNGTFNIDIKEGRLVANGFTNAVKGFSGRDLTTEVYKNGTIDGKINKNLVDFNVQMSAERSDINITKGTLNTANSSINIPVDFRYEKTDAKINITGTTKQPKYAVSSEYLKGKISKEIDKILDKKMGDDNSTKDVVKGLLKGLF